MSRTELMARLLRLSRLAEHCEQSGKSADEAVAQDQPGSQSRRSFAKGVVATTATAAAWSMAPGTWDALAKAPRQGFDYIRSSNIAVVGAGIAGLACAHELARQRYAPMVFEASDRVGGRISSLRDVFPGQVVERGAEFISSSHHTMRGYARAFGLQLESYSALSGKAFYQFGGRQYSEAQVVEEYRAFTASIREDLDLLNSPSADHFDKSAETFDFMSLDDYLVLHGAGPLLRGIIGSAYLAEYGAPIDQLSAMTFLRFAHGDLRSKQAPFGVQGGDLLRVADGNDRITTGLAASLPRPVQLGHRLVAMRRLADGKLRLTFDVDGRTVDSEHEVVVMTLPFSVLRDVELHRSLELPDWKRDAIRTSAMGDHSKLLVGFQQPVWKSHGLNGTGFSDNARMQAVWEANPSKATASHAVMASYVGGPQARNMSATSLQSDAAALLSGLEPVMSGAKASATRNGAGQLLAVAENWSGNPFSKGSQTCNRPGYFTTTANLEAKPVENLLFAGEHTSSFYEWQGFMEGAALSGLRAAGEVMAMTQ